MYLPYYLTPQYYFDFDYFALYLLHWQHFTALSWGGGSKIYKKSEVRKAE